MRNGSTYSLYFNKDMLRFPIYIYHKCLAYIEGQGQYYGYEVKGLPIFKFQHTLHCVISISSEIFFLTGWFPWDWPDLILLEILRY